MQEKNFHAQANSTTTTLKLNNHKRKVLDQKFIRIIDLQDKNESGKILWENKVVNKNLIGQLLSQLFTFIDGYIYFGNNVIKIRLDLL